MDPSKNEPHASEAEEAIASMASIARTLNAPEITSHHKSSIPAVENAISSSANGTAAAPRRRNISSKYRHIAAVHSTARNSCLSRDVDVTPSFLGFRNLMVIVLST